MPPLRLESPRQAIDILRWLQATSPEHGVPVAERFVPVHGATLISAMLLAFGQAQSLLDLARKVRSVVRQPDAPPEWVEAGPEIVREYVRRARLAHKVALDLTNVIRNARVGPDVYDHAP